MPGKNNELNELEKLALKFGKKGVIIDIRGEIYGIMDNKRSYLGTKADYNRYKELKSKHNAKIRRTETEEEKARKSYLEDSAKD